MDNKIQGCTVEELIANLKIAKVILQNIEMVDLEDNEVGDIYMNKNSLKRNIRPTGCLLIGSTRLIPIQA